MTSTISEITPNGVANLTPNSGNSQTAVIPASTSVAVVSNLSPNFIGYVKLGTEADFSTSIAVPPNGQVALAVGSATDISVIGDRALFNIAFGS